MVNERLQRGNLVIDLFSDPNSLGVIPALLVANPCCPVHDALLLLGMFEQGTFFFAHTSPKPGQVFNNTVFGVKLTGLESPTLLLV